MYIKVPFLHLYIYSSTFNFLKYSAITSMNNKDLVQVLLDNSSFAMSGLGNNVLSYFGS